MGRLLFLSHAGSDTEAAQKLAERIENAPEARENGLKVWFDKKDLLSGKAWQEQLEQALERESTAFAVYVGSKGIINWVDSEVRVALSRARSDPDYPFIPILSGQCSGSESLPAFARQYQGVADVENNPDEFAKLIRAATGKETRAQIRLVDDPFLGLRAFEEKDTHLFFGRDEDADKIGELLKRSRMLMVVGDSGSGKSSLVKAGLIPRYRGGALAERRDPRGEAIIWHVVETRPRSNPFDSLADSVAAVARAIGRSQEDIRTLRKMVRAREPQEVADALLDGAPSNSKILLVVDQFEELFTLSDKIFCSDYVKALLYLAKHDSSADLRIVLTMRRDYYNLCHEYPDFYGWFEDSEKRAKFSVHRMSDAQIRECIERPLALAGVTGVDVFINRVLADVGDQAGELALLEMALTESWRRRGMYGNDLLKSYISLGGTAGALSNVAEEVFNKLSDIEQALTEANFIRLVRLGETGGTTRRIASRDEFSDDHWRVLQKLASEDYGRLVYIAGGSSSIGVACETEMQVTGELASENKKEQAKEACQESTETVELSHEALVSQWPRYQGWLQAFPNYKRVHDGLIVAAKNWVKATTKKADELLTGNRLAEAIPILNESPGWLSEQERAFIEASRKRLRNRKIVEKAAIVLLALLTVTAIGFGINAYYLSKVAEEQAEIARRSAYNAQIARASDIWKRDPDLAFKLLTDTTRVPRDLRDISWEILYLFSTWNQIIIFGHGDPVFSVAFSPDGKTLASASRDKTVKLWNAQSRKERATLTGHVGPVSSVAFSPDGKTLASASWDKTVKLWDAQSGKDRATLTGHGDAVSSVAFSPDGKTLASASQDKTVKLWDAQSGKERATLTGHGDAVSSVAFSPDGKTLASASRDKTVKLWDAQSGKERATLTGHGDAVSSVAFSPDGKTLASASRDKTVKLWDAQSGKERATLPSQGVSVSSVAFSPDGKTLASSYDGKKVKLWDAQNGQERATLPSHGGSVFSVAFSPDGKTLASACWDKTVRLWDAQSGKEHATLTGHGDAVFSVAFSPDGKTLASASDDKTVKLWDAQSGKDRATLTGHRRSVFSVAFSPDGKTLASASRDDTVKLWDAQSGKERATLTGHVGPVSSVAFSPDGKTLASACWDKTVKLWDAQSGKERATLTGHGDTVSSVAFSPDGKTLASASWDNTVKLWDAQSGKDRATLTCHRRRRSVSSVAFSPDGKTLASACDDDIVKLWDAQSGKERATLTGHDHSVSSVAFSPDGETLASASGDDTVKLWDAQTGQERATLTVHGGAVYSVAFSPDGKTLASACDDKTVKLWREWHGN